MNMDRNRRLYGTEHASPPPRRLRAGPLSADLDAGNLRHIRDGRRVVVPGIVLVRQKPGSAKGVMFITIEDETGVANLILWPDRFEKQRRLVLSAGMLACHGRVQREGEVVHVITERLEDLSELLRSVGERDEGSDRDSGWKSIEGDRDEAFPLRHGRGDGVTHPAASDPRRPAGVGSGRETHGVTASPSNPAAGIRVPTRDFR